jgi:hypothetical protein
MAHRAGHDRGIDMSEYNKIPTSAEVCAVIRARHNDGMTVFSTFSDPDGTFNGGSGERGRMDTAYGFKGCDWPLIEYRTTWEIDHSTPYKRVNEKCEYWLCIPLRDEE